MKTVYEGNIYILKGAVTGTYTNLAEASKTQKKIYAGEPVGRRQRGGFGLIYRIR